MMITKQDLRNALDSFVEDIECGIGDLSLYDQHDRIAELLDRLPDADAEPTDARGIRKGDAVYRADVDAIGIAGVAIAAADAFELAPRRYAVTALRPDGDHETSYHWRKFDLPAEVRAVLFPKLLFPTLSIEDDNA